MWVSLFAYIPFVVNRTFNAMLTEGLQSCGIIIRFKLIMIIRRAFLIIIVRFFFDRIASTSCPWSGRKFLSKVAKFSQVLVAIVQSSLMVAKTVL